MEDDCLGFIDVGTAPAAPAVQAEATGLHEGTVGTRCDFPNAQCLAVTQLPDGEYGPRFLVKFQTPSGAVLCWFTGEATKFDPQPGCAYNLVATVKEHSVYRGARNTIINRPKGTLCSPPSQPSPSPVSS